MTHGHERNRRVVRTTSGEVTLHEPGGAVVYTGPLFSSERDAAEKWCGCCGEWVDTAEAPSLLGFVCCPRCGEAW